MNTPSCATYRNPISTPDVEVTIEWSPDCADEIEAEGSELPICRLFIHGQPVETRQLRGGARVLAQALVNLVLADHRRRPSEPGPPPAWN
ncbi:hypothetical protein [Metallibacterium scheffleri]